MASFVTYNIVLKNLQSLEIIRIPSSVAFSLRTWPSRRLSASARILFFEQKARVRQFDRGEEMALSRGWACMVTNCSVQTKDRGVTVR